MSVHGSCLCGAVQYEVEPPFTMMMNCHCSMCRKHHGAPFATFAAAPISQFRWVSGENELAFYSSSPSGRRCFCRVCGSVAPLLLPEMGIVMLAAGTLDGDPGIRPQSHMFTGSKAPWHYISDALPQHEGYPPEFGDASPIDRPEARHEAGKTFGSCLCGEVAYEFTGSPMVTYQCHCSRCRKARSAAHGANAFYRIEQFRWLRGEDRVTVYRPPEAQRFAVASCVTCGSGVPAVSLDRKTVVAPAAALDSDPGIAPKAHIFVGSKAPWFEITDSIPQIEGLPSPPAQRAEPTGGPGA